MRKGLLISGYHSISQKSWAEFITAELTHIEWTVIALPPRYFSWRMRGNPLSIGQLAAESVAQTYDLILATSSVDLATVQSIYPSLRSTPSLLYFHDNQFDYPLANNPQSVVDWQITHIYSAIRAEKLLFNSQYNQDSFLSGVKHLLNKMPDLAPKQLAVELKNKSSVLPVPINPPVLKRTTRQQKTLKVVWNHRWEWDKCPDLLEAVVNQFETMEVTIEILITGQQFRKSPDNFTRLQHNKTIVTHCGFIDDEASYFNLLATCDVVLSTAIHEFQGIAVLEAVAAGCVPLLPKRLSYPEIYPAPFLYPCSGNYQQQALEIVQRLRHWQSHGLPEPPDVSRFFRSHLISAYQRVL